MIEFETFTIGEQIELTVRDQVSVAWYSALGTQHFTHQRRIWRVVSIEPTPASTVDQPIVIITLEYRGVAP